MAVANACRVAACELAAPAAVGVLSPGRELDHGPDQRLLAVLAAALEPVFMASLEELVDLDLTGQKASLGSDHRAPEFLQAQPRRLIARKSQPALQLLGRDPGSCVATRYAAQNHVRSGVRVGCITVPAVTELCTAQPEHCHRCRR